MTTLRCEHILTFLDGTTLDEHLAEYRRAGFVVADHTVRHEPGLRTGFVFFGAEYLEFCWVEDEALYAAGAGADPLSDPAFRAARRPYSIGLISADVAADRGALQRRGFTLPEVEYGGSRDDPPGAAPRWAFLNIPAALTPGAVCFALTYLRYPTGSRRSVRVAANTTYAFAGITFVTAEPGEHAGRWRALLAPEADLEHAADLARCQVGPHTLTWLTPQRYRAEYGLEWQPAAHQAGAIALLHLLATDLAGAERVLREGGREVSRSHDGGSDAERLLAPADTRDGFNFVIVERTLATWHPERVAMTGELLDIAT